MPSMLMPSGVMSTAEMGAKVRTKGTSTSNDGRDEAEQSEGKIELSDVSEKTWDFSEKNSDVFGKISNVFWKISDVFLIARRFLEKSPNHEPEVRIFWGEHRTFATTTPRCIHQIQREV